MQLLPSAGCFRSWLAPLAAFALVFLTAQPFRLSGQVTADAVAVTKRLPVFTSAREAVATVTERGPHHRVEQWVERLIGEDGTTNDVTHSATVLANGLHYLDGGEWKETVPEFVPVNGGWLAARGPHQVLVSARLFVAGAVTVVSPEGQTWRSTPMTLALRDRAGGQVWVLGESRDVAGELVAPDTVLFRDAFAGEAGVKADVRVVTSAGGVECDVIVRSGVPTREALGEAGENAELVVLTEIFEPGGATANPVDRGGRSDDVVRLGALTMDQGKAFGTDLPGPADRSVPVFKRVYKDEPSGRVFLEEATPLDSLTPLLEALSEARVPGPTEARWRNTVGGKTRPPGSAPGSADFPVRRTGLLPAPTLPRRADGRFEVATTVNVPRTFAAVKSQPGVVLDWSYLNSATNFTFRGDTTYRVTNAVTLSGTNVTFEVGTVIKFDAGVNASVSIASGVNFDWQAEPFRPVTFTARDDDSLGDKITGSTGNPSGTYAATALFLNGSGRTNGLVLTNLRVRHANYGVEAVYFGQNGPLTLRHGQFLKCAYPFKFQLGYTGADTYFLQNLLVTEANTLFKDGYYAKVSGQFLTVNGLSTWFASQYSPHYCTLTVADSILSAVGSVNVGTTNNCWVASNATNLFEAVGAGAYYLPGQSPVRGVIATQPLTALDAATRATTLAPLVLTNVTAALTLSPWQTAGDAYTLGYHYDPVDWYASNVVVTNATLTLTNGVTVALGGSVGFQLDSGAKWVAVGTPLAPNRLVRASLVQDGTNGLTGSTFNAFTVGNASPAAELTARFTHTFLPSESTGRRHWLNLTTDRLTTLTVTDCQWANVSLTLSPTASTVPQTVTLANCLFDGGRLYFSRYYDHNLTVSLRHSLVRRGECWANYYGQPTQNPVWTVQDNLFDQTSLLNTAGAYLTGGYNGYTGSTATFGGSGNKTSLTATYDSGPLGRFYYPATGASSSLTNLLDAGSVTDASTLGFYHYTTLAVGPREGTGRLDIGFHYPLAAAADALADTDQDGLSDWAEDLDRDGTVNSGETDPNNADSDQDGALDGEELAAGTDPNSTASWIPKRLAAWWWDTSTGNWKNGDRGQAPLVNQNGNATNGVVNGGIHFPTNGTTPLRYAVRESNGRLYARLDHGSLKLWLKPDWVWTNHPTKTERLFEVGNFTNVTTGWWAWAFRAHDGDGSSNIWRLELLQNSTNTYPAYPSPRYAVPLNNSTWGSSQWHQLVMSYDPVRTVLYDGGTANLWKDYSVTPPYEYSTGNGILTNVLPTAAYQTTNGFVLGSDTTGQFGRLGGGIDSLETFNYPQGEVEMHVNQQLTIQIVTNGAARHLKVVRQFEGSPTNLAPTAIWPLTLWRRPLGGTNWGTHLFTNSIAESWTDTNVTAGVTYEYKAQFPTQPTMTLDYVRHFFAGVAMPPQHQRGNVILVLDSTLEPFLTNEIAILKTNLVGDGWTVTNILAARHNDTNWGVNTNNLPTVAANIVSAAKTGTTNVVFILGHVTIPYSGRWASDGHTSTNANLDHQGAWVADAYYGYLSKAGWTDTNSWSDSVTGKSNLPGDGKFDQDALAATPGFAFQSVGRLPDMAVGRLDFAKLPLFEDAPWVSAAAQSDEIQLEVELIRMYLAKNVRYRIGGIPTFGRVSAFNTQPYFAPRNVANIAQGLAGAAFGMEPGQVFNGGNLRDLVPADFGVAHSYAFQLETGVHDDRFAGFTSTTFADPSKEVPVIFRNAWCSYAPDWARMNQFDRFDKDNNWIRASLGWTNYGLAITAGPGWDFGPLGGGAPLAATMTHGWEGLALVERFQGILGDPTLRLFRVTPPTILKAIRAGSAVTLTWLPSSEANQGYYVYRSTNGLAGFTTPLNSAPTLALSFADTTTATNLLYQVRAAKLQVTGSGSFTNLSQGIFIAVP